MKRKRLEREFYQQPAPILAPQLLGKILCRRLDNRVVRWQITETEAYYGVEDTACHASKGRTARTEIMYADGGHAYVYLCYGIHEMFNVVSGREGSPEAVLIRGVSGVSGPGRVTRATGISRVLNKVYLVTSRDIWFEDIGSVVSYTTAPRVGINYAMPEDRQRLWRFIAELECSSGSV